MNNRFSSFAARSFFNTSLLLFLLATNLLSQAVSFRRSTPEKEGVSSAAISSFLDAFAKSRSELHGFVFVRHGKIIADGWAKPYGPELKHTMYSTSKSFTSTAVGLAVAEKKLTVNDKVISFFPDLLPDTVSQFMSQLTVKDLLTMSVGQTPDPSGVIIPKPQWVKLFLSTPIIDKPGTRFLYNSMATFMLSAIVQKVTGEKILDYLEPRLFQPLGIQNKDWETNAEGINAGGWGLRLTTTDMAKFGQLYLQKGNWNGNQLIPASWITDATSAQIIQNPEASQGAKDSSDWLQGYGYQFWRSRHNSYRADGAFGQYILVFPQQDAVIAITSESPNMQEELNFVWKFLLPAMKPGSLPANNMASTQLKKQLNELSVTQRTSQTDTINSTLIIPFPSKDFQLQENNQDLKGIHLKFETGTLELALETSKDTYRLPLGAGDWLISTTERRGPGLTNRAANSMVGLPPSIVAGRYKWLDKTRLQLEFRYLESPHTEVWTCKFDGDAVEIEVRTSITMMRSDKPEAILKSR
jgi:CubicO group peptidase (beta-lactamase class C family)